MTIRSAVPLVLLAILGCSGGGGGGSSGSDEPAAPATWRSSLFPANWTPATTDPDGNFLHDFAYAGYRGGEAPLPDLAALPSVDVVADFGADPTGTADSTSAFQAALDADPPGVVRVPPGLFRCDGLLTVTRSGVVLAGEGAAVSRIYFTRHAGMTGLSHLTIRGSATTQGDHLLSEDGAAREFEVRLADATGLSVGDHVLLGWVITPEFIDEHGMTGTWQAFNGTWQAFLRREVRSVDLSGTPHRVTLDAPLRYPAKVRDGASLRIETGAISDVGVVDLGLANAVAWDDAWANDRVHVLEMSSVRDAWIRGVASFEPPGAPASGPGAGSHLQNGGIMVSGSKRVTVADSRMEKAEHRGGGGCGYLFEIRQSAEVLTRDCTGIAGRHNFIQNWGFGVTGCVWLRCHTAEGFAIFTQALPTLGQLGLSEFHHSLATANLIDSTRIDDGWGAQNRNDYSTGAGHTATECVFWNTTGDGVIRSRQFGQGYVIGTGPNLAVETSTGGAAGSGTAPEDPREGEGEGPTLDPQSLYEAQFRLRTGREPETAP